MHQSIVTLKALTSIFQVLTGSRLMAFDFSAQRLRFTLQTRLAGLLLAGSDQLNLVLDGCRHFYYLSYTNLPADRHPNYNLFPLFQKHPEVQGITSPEPDKYILFTSLPAAAIIEAGELHFTATHFQLYDQAFGKITYEFFCEAINC